MRKLLFLSALLLVGSLLATSCMDDDDGHTDVQCQYGGTLGSLHDFADAADSTLFYALISEAFEELGVVGSASIFTIDTTVSISSQSYAYYVTDYMANARYESMLDGLSLTGVKSAIFALHSDSLVGEGILSAAALPLEGFTATFELYRDWESEPIATYDLDF